MKTERIENKVFNNIDLNDETGEIYRCNITSAGIFTIKSK